MAPLLPSESSTYTLKLPEEVDDDRYNLKVRTGAALTYTTSSIVVHGGLTTGLSLQTITIPEIKKQFELLKDDRGLSHFVSNEIFYLNIINRKWSRLPLDPTQPRPKPRFFHSLAFHDNSIFLFGGLTVDEDTNEIIPAKDLWEFNIDNLEWHCLDDGYISGTVARYDHTMVISCYTSAFDGRDHSALVIAAGKGELNESLSPVIIYDLERRKFVPTTVMELILNEKSTSRSDSESAGTDSKSRELDPNKYRLKLRSDSSFIISGTSNIKDSEVENVLYILDPLKHEDLVTPDVNPIISLPLVPRAAGLRLPLSDVMKKKYNSAVPTSLQYPSGGVFGSNIIVSGFVQSANEYQLYLFNKPSQKWTRLNIDSKATTTKPYYWKSISWPSHHKVLILGSSIYPSDAEFPTIQTFDLLVSVGLPITNIFHTFSNDKNSAKFAKDKSFVMRPSTSFEEYSKYISPSTKISSIRTVFPNYAVTLGRNAFERFGPSLSDFEFVTADGDKVNVPVMLLRKRWNRCFDMLLAKGYARAVHELDSKKLDDSDDEEDEEDETSDMHSLRSDSASKRSALMISSVQHTDNAPPQFRLPFQDSTSLSVSPPSHSISIPPTSSGGPTSRKASVISTGNLSITSTSTSGGLSSSGFGQEIDLDSLPTQLPLPNEPLPPLDSKIPLRSFNSRDFRDSPRGSISGSSLSGVNTYSANKLKDFRAAYKKRGVSRSSSLPTSSQDEQNTATETASNFDPTTNEEGTATLLEPLLIPRSMYLPFSTPTIQAFAEFLFTGQLGDKWLLYPTTSDNFLLAKFYELPLLYDLISEVLYAIIGKKEDSLIKEFGKLSHDYDQKVKALFNGNEHEIHQFYKEHPNVDSTFKEVEDMLNAVDDGYLNINLLRKASKVSSGSMSTPHHHSVDGGNDSNLKSPKAKKEKSSLSQEVSAERSDIDGVEEDDEFENENEDDDDDDDEEFDDVTTPVRFTGSQSQNKHLKTELFKTTTSSSSNASKHGVEENDPLDPITPLKRDSSVNYSDTQFESKYDSSEVDSDDRKAIGETKIIDGRSQFTANLELDDEDPLSSSTVDGATGESDYSIDPLSQPSSVNPKVAGISAVDFQVPENRFHITEDEVVKVVTSSSSDRQKESTSDSDDMAVGLGLVNLKLDKPDKVLNSIKKEDEDGENDTDKEVPPTLESLASPSSPPPPVHLLQVIYETAALACDMKLLLRSMNVLEMTKTFEATKQSLLTELIDLEKQYHKRRSESESISKVKKEEPYPIQQFDAKSDQQFAMKKSFTEDFTQHFPASPPSHRTKHVRSSFEVNADEHDGTDASVRSFSIRSTFSNILPSRTANTKIKASNSREFPDSTPRHSILNPFSRKKTNEEGNKRGGFISKLSKKGPSDMRNDKNHN